MEEQQNKKYEINPKQLSFKQFLEKIRDDSGLSQEDFLKYKITLPINNFNAFNMLKQFENVSLELEKRTEKELKDDTYLKELNRIDPNLISLKTELNEFYAKTSITQYFKNYSNNSVELILKFPYSSSIQFSKFTLEMNNKKVISRVLGKEKAEEKYNDAIAEGKVGAISKRTEKNIQVTIGNIGPNELIKLTSEFIQFLTTEDMSYCFTTMKNFPQFCSKKKNLNIMFKIQANIKIKTHSKITRLITKGFRQYIEKIFNNDYTTCDLKYYSWNNTEKELFENNFKILFRTESMNKLNLITQYDHKKNETSCIFSMVYNKKDINIPVKEKPDLADNEDYIKLYQKDIINNNPSLFIFLIDQSGSMAGKPISIVKESLKLFLQSLPKNSYFQLIGFSNKANYIYSRSPVIYNTENVNKTISQINCLKAQGGTYLFSPLKKILSSIEYEHIHLCRNLFILTDGEVENSERCLSLISNNSNLYRVHAFGIGNDYDKNFIEKAGKNGSYNFIPNIDVLKENLINILNKALRGYIFNPKISVDNIEKKYEFIPNEKIYYQDEVFNYYFIIHNKISDKINIDFEYYDKNQLIKEEFIFDEKNIIKENDGDIISKIIMGNILNNNNTFEEKQEIVLAKKYQILSKSTALYAEIENEDANKALSQLEVVEQSEINSIEPIKYYKKNKDNDSEESEESESSSSSGSGSDSDSEKYDEAKRRPKKKTRPKCNKRMPKESSSESESSDREVKYRKKVKCKKKASSEDESSEQIEIIETKKMRKKAKCKKEVSSEDESSEPQKKTKSKKMIKKCNKKEVSSEDESSEPETKTKTKKTKKMRKKCRKKEVSSEDESSNSYEKDEKMVEGQKSENSDSYEEKSIKKNAFSYDLIEFSPKKEKDFESEIKKPKHQPNFKVCDSVSKEDIFESFNINAMISTQDIIEGNWSLNFQTQKFIEANKSTYDKIKNIVEKYYQNDDKENVIITILVIYYLKKMKSSEYNLIINKGIGFLQSKGIEEINYKNIEPYLNE